ncbi:hypothetical protein SEEE1831_07339, partial [Salmonella enterica subsp. enterica serovar Enteritidis str. 13183-1]
AEPMQLASDPLSMRIYTVEECERLDASCRGFLLFLDSKIALSMAQATTCSLLAGLKRPASIAEGATRRQGN